MIGYSDAVGRPIQRDIVPRGRKLSVILWAKKQVKGTLPSHPRVDPREDSEASIFRKSTLHLGLFVIDRHYSVAPTFCRAIRYPKAYRSY